MVSHRFAACRAPRTKEAPGQNPNSNSSVQVDLELGPPPSQYRHCRSIDPSFN